MNLLVVLRGVSVSCCACYSHECHSDNQLVTMTMDLSLQQLTVPHGNSQLAATVVTVKSSLDKTGRLKLGCIMLK